MVRDTIVCLLAGGAGERLYPLTRDRAKPAVTFGGIYRIIDITLSNCINSDLRRIFVLTQYKALSLNRHIREGWSMLAGELGEFIQILPPMMRVGDYWYRGTADAIFQNIYSIGSEPCKYVMILSGDHVYKMNYQLMIQRHIDAGAEATVGVIEVDVSEASRFGVVELDSHHRIVGWQEKPPDPKPSPHNPEKCYASMGIYCFNRDVLLNCTIEDADDPRSNHDFGKDIIPKLLQRGNVYAYDFVDENKKEAQDWRDIGNLVAYYEANMDLVAISPVFNLYDSSWPIRTYQRQYPPAKFVFAQEGRRMGIAADSLVSAGLVGLGRRGAPSHLSPNLPGDRHNGSRGAHLSFPLHHRRLSRHVFLHAVHGSQITMLWPISLPPERARPKRAHNP